MTYEEKIQNSIQILRKSESLALRYSEKGYYLAFSGGKDSQALYHIAKLAGVKFEAHYSLTTIDPPELVHFIKENYPDVIIDLPKMVSFYRLCLKKKALPTRMMRFCCAELKESRGAGTVTLTGVRRQESAQRSKRNVIEVSNHKFSGSIDQFNDTQETRSLCVSGKDKIIINPIIDWLETDVWRFLSENRISHCTLYDTGKNRIGCLFCPMSSKKSILIDKEEYPKYYQAIIRLIHRLRINGYMNSYQDLSDEQVFEWWRSKLGIRKWYSDNMLTKDLFN